MSGHRLRYAMRAFFTPPSTTERPTGGFSLIVHSTRSSYDSVITRLDPSTGQHRTSCSPSSIRMADIRLKDYTRAKAFTYRRRRVS